MKTPQKPKAPSFAGRGLQEQEKTSIVDNSTTLLHSCQVIPTTSTKLVGTDEELEILANFILAQEADQ